MLLWAAADASSQDPPPPPPHPMPAPPTPLTAVTNAPVKELGGGRYQVGKVVLDKTRKTVTFPTVVNMNSAMVEYVLVTTSGKVHESILRTDVEPYHIQTAMLLLGAKGAMTADPAVFNDPKQPVPGDKVTIEVVWKDGAKAKRGRAEEFIMNLETKKSISRGPWVYNGSQIVDGMFVAQREGSIVSLIGDPYALVNNPRIGRENDEIWGVNTNAIPELNTMVEVIFKLE
jgi:hypothetical protein